MGTESRLMETRGASVPEDAATDDRSEAPARAAAWLSWLLGGALLVTVVVAALHVSEGREFARLLERANLWWLAFALLLQAATYLAQAEVFRSAPQAAGMSLPRRWLYQLSLSKWSV